MCVGEIKRQTDLGRICYFVNKVSDLFFFVCTTINSPLLPSPRPLVCFPGLFILHFQALRCHGSRLKCTATSVIDFCQSTRTSVVSRSIHVWWTNAKLQLSWMNRTDPTYIQVLLLFGRTYTSCNGESLIGNVIISDCECARKESGRLHDFVIITIINSNFLL